jgi:hypothetical protein
MATEGRITQDIVEILSQPTTVAARVTQDVVELLSATTVLVVAERVELFIWMPV